MKLTRLLLLLTLGAAAYAVEGDPVPCASRYRRFAVTPQSPDFVPPSTALIPGSEIRLTPLDDQSIAVLASQLTRDTSFFSLFDHLGHWLGVNPKTNFPKGEPVLFFAEAKEAALASPKSPRWSLNDSKHFDSGSKDSVELSGNFYRTLIKDQRRQHTRDPKWVQVGNPPYSIFAESSDSEAMKAFMESLLGKHVSGINLMTNETQGETFSIFSGQVRRVFTMRASEYDGFKELVYAEIITPDGKPATVLLTPQKAMASNDLYVYDYQYPSKVAEHRSALQTERRASAQNLQLEFRASPIMQGASDVGNGRPIPTDAMEFLDLLEKGAKTISRLEDPRSMASGLRKIGALSIEFFFPKKKDYAALQAGDVVFDLWTAKYFVVGVDKIPDTLLHKSKFALKESRLVLVRPKRAALPSPQN